MSQNQGQKVGTISVHRESCLVGMKMMHAQITGKLAQDDYVANVLPGLAQNFHVNPRSFPLDLLDGHLAGKDKERKNQAASYLHTLLMRVPEPMLMTRVECERLVEQAWNLVACMETQAGVASLLDSTGGG